MKHVRPDEYLSSRVVVAVRVSRAVVRFCSLSVNNALPVSARPVTFMQQQVEVCLLGHDRSACRGGVVEDAHQIRCHVGVQIGDIGSADQVFLELRRTGFIFFR